MTDEQIIEFNAFYETGCKKMKGLAILDGYRPKGIGFFEKIRANKAIKSFEKALSIYPDHFQSQFLLGKLYQRLGEYNKSLFYLESALKIEHTNHNIPLEASLVAMHLKQIDKSIEYSKEAVRRKPDDIAVLGNHSMNLLIVGLDDEAKEAINKAISINPNDNINRQIKIKIDGVIAGYAKRPTFEEAIG